MDDIKRILLVSAPPRNFRKIINYGISLSKKYGAKLYILHSFYDPFHVRYWDQKKHCVWIYRHGTINCIQQVAFKADNMKSESKI